jgi:hypothetical protein
MPFALSVSRLVAILSSFQFSVKNPPASWEAFKI